MKRRICLVGAALSLAPLAFGVTAATAKPKPKPKPKPSNAATKINCTTNTGIMVAAGDTGITPPAQQGTEYGTAACAKPLGQGVQADSFTIDDSGDNVANFRLYFDTGTLHGSYDLSRRRVRSTMNFLEVDYLGTLTVKGGTGAFAGSRERAR